MKSIFLNSNDIDILIKDDLVTIGSHTYETSLKNLIKTK